MLDRETMIDRLIARYHIDDLLSRYVQAIDRCDAEKLKPLFWPDAVIDLGVFAGKAPDFVQFAMSMLKSLNSTMHFIAKGVVEFDDDDNARGETYLIAFHEVPEETGIVDRVGAGRYIDRFQRRNGEWRIAERVYVADWNQNTPSTAEWNTWAYSELKRRGARYPDDPTYSLFVNKID